MKKMLTLLLVLFAVRASAQTVNADRVRLNTGPCVLDGVDGTPDQLRLVGSCSGITTSAATNLTIMPTGDLEFNPTGKDILPVNNYDLNIGALSKKYLSLHAAELWVETLVAQNTIATIGGRVLVAPTNILTTDVGTGDTSILVKYNNLANGDRVYLEADGKVEFMAVTSGASGGGPYTYSVTRNLDGSGANQWYAGDAVLNTGTTGNGFIDLYSTAGVLSSGSGPSIVGNVRTGAAYNAYAPRWAIGNLNGLYGYGATTYGAAFGDASNTNVTVDATNGFRIRSGTTNKFVADPSGNLSIVGDLSVGTSGVIRSNATALGTGVGYWLAYNGGSPEFRVGDPANSYMQYSDGVLTIRGGGSSVTNLVRNSDCDVSNEDWTSFTNTGFTIVIGRSQAFGSTYSLDNGAHGCYFNMAGTPSAGQQTEVYTPTIPAQQGHRYEGSFYVNAFATGNTQVVLQFLNAAGSEISSAIGNTCAATAADGRYLQNYCRTGVIADAPSTTSTIRLILITTHTATANPAVFWVHSFFGENPTGVVGTGATTTLSAWGPAGITEISGGVIATDAVTADKIAANSITSAKIAANTITAADIAAGTITATELNVSTLSAISANMGTLTAGSITGGTIDGATVRAGSGDEVTLDSSGITFTAGTGTNNKIKFSDGAQLYAPSGTGLYTNGNFTVEDVLVVNGASGIDLTVPDLGVADSITFVNMPSSTGTAVIWENSCGCLKKDSSSVRYKESIRPWFSTDPLGILRVTPILFDYRDNGVKGVLGLSAEDLAAVSLDLVNLNSVGQPDSVRQNAVNAYFIEALRELHREIIEMRK